MADANIRAVITADDKASSVLSKFGKGIESVGGTAAHVLGSVVKGAAIAATAGIAGLTAASIASVKAFEESENAAAQLNAVLKSTKGVAGVTADEALKLATSLQRLTKFSDEEIVSAESLLLTFTNINKKIFPETTKIVLDMSQALGQDLKSSAIQVGKALQDPILGVTALRRVGVNFSEKQQEVIKNLVNTGQAAKAQALILKELNAEFGGSAEAAGTTFSGKLKRLENSLNDVQEAFGKIIVEAITPFVEKLANFVNSDRFQGWVEALPQKILELQNAIVNFGAFFVEKFEMIKAKFNEVKLYFESNPFLHRWLETVSGLLTRLSEQINGELIPAMKGFWITIGPEAQQFLRSFAALLGGVLMFSITGVLTVVNALAQGFTIVLNTITALKVGIDNLVNSSGWKAINNFSAGPITKAIGGLRIPGFAEGVTNFSGGAAIVGERGPELVTLPRGANVTPNNKLGGSTINISVNAGAFMGNPSDARAYARLIVEHMKDIAAAKNMTATEMLS